MWTVAGCFLLAVCCVTYCMCSQGNGVLKWMT
jgi:hypothetical protein